MVVFRHPVNRSQVWVKRVIGRPGDHVQMRAGRLWINGEVAALKRDGSALTDEGVTAARYIETLPGGRTHAILKLNGYNAVDDTPDVVVPAGHLFVMATIATIRPTAGSRPRKAASDCSPWRI